MKFRYRNEDEMKYSRVEWLGKIPQNWNIKKIKHLFILKNSKSFDENPVVLSLTQKGLKIRDISKNEGQLASSYIGYIKVNKNDLILNPMDLISGYADKSDIEGVISPAYIIFTERENSKLCNNYYKYYFQMHYHNNFLFPWGEGVSFQHRWTLKNETFLNLPIIYSNNIFEQKKIGDFLDKKTAEFDSIISKKEALIEKLEEAKKSLISEVVTGKVKVVKTSDGYELVQRKKEEMKNSGFEWLGEIPKEWKTTKLKLKTIQVNRGKSPEYVEESKIKVINQACIYWDCFNLKNVKYQNEINLGERGKLYKNDILINSTGTGTLGRANIFKEDGNFIADSHVTIIRCKDKSFADYLKYVFRTDLYQGLIYSTIVTGSTNQIELSREGLRNMIVLDISNEELNLINNILEDKINKINLVIDKTKSEIEKLKEAKQSLISEAVTGKIEILE